MRWLSLLCVSQVNVEVNDSLHSMDFCDTNMWRILLERAAAEQAPAEFTPRIGGSRKLAAGRSDGSASSSLPAGAEHAQLDTAAAATKATAAVGAGAGAGKNGGVVALETIAESDLHLNAGAATAAAGVAQQPSFHERDMFLSMSSLSLEALVLLWEHAVDDYLVSRCHYYHHHHLHQHQHHQYRQHLLLLLLNLYHMYALPILTV